MFNDKRYSEVNREERQYCALFAHSLLASHACRERFAALVKQRTNVSLDPSDMEVYVEVAALRDYWRDLGDPSGYSPETHERRRAVLGVIFETLSLNASLIEAQAVFWTREVGTTKLWHPGRWDLSKLETAGLGALKLVKWAFNAKPDMLIWSPSGGIILEAKVESGEGRDSVSGYEQLETQKLVAKLLRALVPCFASVDLGVAALQLRRNSERDFTWADILTVTDVAEIDPFTRTCLGRLVRYG